MVNSPKKVKALGLCSGGLDSILSALVLKEQSIDVTWVSFETPFFSSMNSRKASKITGVPLIVQNITPVYLEMLKAPRGGYGKNMNPCMDCHALMFKLAGEIMREEGYDFLFSGEVLGQRPMSQRKNALQYVEKHSGVSELILRPLSAKLLPETLMEQDGRVDRERLLDISGRSRKPQMKLAEEYGITEYPSPAGGCLLTDKGYSNRLRDLFEHDPVYDEADLHLLKYGRHLRLTEDIKLIAGRNHKENVAIEKLQNPEKYILVQPHSFSGPRVLVSKTADKEHIILAASICIGYSKVPESETAEVLIINADDHECVKTYGISPKELQSKII